MRRALVAVLMVWALASGAQTQTARTEAGQAPQPPRPRGGSPDPPVHPIPQPQIGTKPTSDQPPPQQNEQPTFRVGATFVRVDAFVTDEKTGQPVADLKPEDFEVREDNVAQAVRTFEYVDIPPGFMQTGVRRDPNTVAESRALAADPRRRVFVVFLDTYHTQVGSDVYVRGPLNKFLLRMIGPDDLVAVMTPEMSAEGISFSPRTESIEAILNTFWGRRDRLQQDPYEDLMQNCFSNRDDFYQMRERRRAKLALDALESLVAHLDGIREERKAVIAVTEGWLRYRPDNRIIEGGGQPVGPGIIVGPGGQPVTRDPRQGDAGMNRGECDRVRLELASIDTFQQIQDLPDRANRTNVSFYPVDPRGLAAFDGPIAYTPITRPLNVDHAMLTSKLDTLREFAERTDGIAAVSTNDLTGALQRIARDLSAYYLIGYDSTNPRLDGSYRKISVRVKRPGVKVRARKGYRAAIDGTITSRGGRGSRGDAGPAGDGGGTQADGRGPSAGAAGNGSGEGSDGKAGGATGRRDGGAAAAPNPNADIANAVSTLTATRADLPIRLRVAAVRLASAPGSTDVATELRELRVLAELDVKTAANPFWQQGGTARIVVRSAEGENVASTDATLPLGERTLSVTVPLSPDVKSGEYRVQVRLTTASKTDSVGDSVGVVVPGHAMHIGEPAVLRRGPSTGLTYVPTADLRFRRQERVRLESPFVIPLTRVKASLVDQRGQPLPLPVNLTERTSGSAHLLVADLSLAPLAAGGYAVLLTDTDDTRGTRILVPLQVIP